MGIKNIPIFKSQIALLALPMRNFFSFLFLLLIATESLSAQVEQSLTVISFDNPSFLKSIPYKKSFINTIEQEQEMQRVLLTCYDDAYLTASYDSIINDSLNTIAYLNVGKLYRWATLKKGNVDEGVLSEIGFREKFYSGKPLYFKDVKKVQEKIVSYYENNGYPFASVKLDSVVITDSTLSAQLFLKKYQELKIDSIVVKGSAKISKVYINNYLGIKPGSLYNESKVKKVNTRLSELPFIRATTPAQVVFTASATKLLLFLDHKKASRFDGIVGIMSDPQTQKTYFTGDIKLGLQNALGKGELVDLNWRRLQTQTQDLKLRLVYPFLLKTPFGIDYNLKLYKRDTSFLDVYQNIGLQYMLSGGNYFKVFYSNKTSSLLSTKGLELLTTLPDYADITANMYGAGIKYEKLDYRFNPRKGFYFIGDASVGTKVIRKNNNLNPVIYDNINLSTTQYNGDLEVGVFIPFGKISTVKLGTNSAFLSGKNIFKNELYRIGGLKTLRGFNEETIFASTYSILTLEYRLLLEQNSYLYVFGDGAWYENNSLGNYLQDTPYGFGAGVSFETKAGIFSINYALGKQFNNPILLRDGKVHFGFVNFF